MMMQVAGYVDEKEEGEEGEEGEAGEEGEEGDAGNGGRAALFCQQPTQLTLLLKRKSLCCFPQYVLKHSRRRLHLRFQFKLNLKQNFKKSNGSYCLHNKSCGDEADSLVLSIKKRRKSGAGPSTTGGSRKVKALPDDQGTASLHTGRHCKEA
jgi:hypothetical protein